MKDNGLRKIGEVIDFDLFYLYDFDTLKTIDEIYLITGVRPIIFDGYYLYVLNDSIKKYLINFGKYLEKKGVI